MVKSITKTVYLKGVYGDRDIISLLNKLLTKEELKGFSLNKFQICGQYIQEKIKNYNIEESDLKVEIKTLFKLMDELQSEETNLLDLKKLIIKKKLNNTPFFKNIEVSNEN